jgi:hypothetical protein
MKMFDGWYPLRWNANLEAMDLAGISGTLAIKNCH